MLFFTHFSFAAMMGFFTRFTPVTSATVRARLCAGTMLVVSLTVPQALLAQSYYGSRSQGYVSPLQPLQSTVQPLYPSRVGSQPEASPLAAPPSAPAPSPTEAAAIPPASEEFPIAPLAIKVKTPTPIALPEAVETTDSKPYFPMPAPPTRESVAATATPPREAGFIAPLPTLQPSVAPKVASTPKKDIIEPGIEVVYDKSAPAKPIATGSIPFKSATNVVEPPAVAGVTMQGGPAPELSAETKAALARFPKHLSDTPDAPIPKGSGKVSMKRVSPDIAEIIGIQESERKYESAGISISVRRAGLDTNRELNSAYDALVAGDSVEAIEIYREILHAEPRNQDALFGLAATYHRNGDVQRARPLYVALLKLNPTHREALNNFLAVVSEEAPEAALAELAQLEQKNPEFSPIPAQMGLLLDRLGQYDEARQKLKRAIRLSPDNLVYQYNLAIMLDTQGAAADALALYRSLIQAGIQGAKIPASIDSLQRRANFLANRVGEAPRDSAS